MHFTKHLLAKNKLMTKLKVHALVCSLVLFCGYSGRATAQSIDDIRADHQTYVTGTGSGSTLKAADQTALTEIIEQISLQIQSNFETVKTEKDKNLKETVRDVVKTYSNATLTNTERIILQDEPNARVFRYIKRSEIFKIFEARKNKIVELARNGIISLGNFQVADALRYFYWSQTLLRSHPEASEIGLEVGGKSELLVAWLPLQINQIFSDLKLAIDSVESNSNFSNYLLDIRYKNNPVQNFDYTYWTGQDWSNIISSKDGIGVVELPGSHTAKVIRVKAEYAFEGESNIDLELRHVMENLPIVPYKNSYFTVSVLPKSKPVGLSKKEIQVVVGSKNLADSLRKPEFAVNKKETGLVALSQGVDENNQLMQQVLAAVTHKNFNSVQSLFTEEGFGIFQKLLQYGNARIIKSTDLKYFQYGDFVICRSVPMSFSFKSNNQTFVEEVVFYFDSNHKICNLTFSLSEKAVQDIASNENWSEANRMLLISFLENYKTAFALKRFDYISNVFADDALIITGYYTKINSKESSPYSNNQIIKYNHQTKSEYLKRLKYSFDSKEYINIRFTENNIRRSGKGRDIYGIQIKQDYFSANYGDSGFLFLLVDLSDTIKPQIHVRTWQPEKNADGNIYGLADF